MGLRVYVAGRIAEATKAKAVAQLLRMDGHSVVSRWRDLDEHPEERALDRDARRFICSQNLGDLRLANTALVLVRPEIKGALVELVWAWSQGMEVIAVGDPFAITLMADLPGILWLPTFEEARLELARRMHR